MKRHLWPFGNLEPFKVGCGLGFAFLLWTAGSETLEAQNPAPGSAQTTNAILQQNEQLKAAQSAKPKKAAASEEGEAAPETYPGESEDLGPQMLLKKKKRPPLFEANADTMLLWTSNALASPWGNARDTAIFAETASLTLAPQPIDVGSGKLSLRSGYRHVFWVYDLRNTASVNDLPLNGFNFQVSTVFLNARYNFLEKWNASFGVDYTRVMSAGTTHKWRPQRLIGPMGFWQESYVDITPNWSLDRSFSLGEKMALTLSYNGAYHFSETFAYRLKGQTPYNGLYKGNCLDKLDSGVSASLMIMPTEKFLISPSVRFTHSLFTRTQSESDLGEHRRTTLISPGLTFMWMPNPRASVRMGLSADFFRSNDGDQPSYNKFDASTGLSFTLKF